MSKLNFASFDLFGFRWLPSIVTASCTVLRQCVARTVTEVPLDREWQKHGNHPPASIGQRHKHEDIPSKINNRHSIMNISRV